MNEQTNKSKEILCLVEIFNYFETSIFYFPEIIIKMQFCTYLIAKYKLGILERRKHFQLELGYFS